MIVATVDTFSALAHVTVTPRVTPLLFYALDALYDSTNGSSWKDSKGWLSSEPLAAWAGITVSEDALVALDLSANNLHGPLPTRLGDLTTLRVLHLKDNTLTGRLPSSIGNLRQLTTLDVRNNPDLAGPLPAAIVELPLTTLLVRGSGLCAPPDIRLRLSQIDKSDVPSCLADTERAALEALYNATGGPAWTASDGWMTSAPLSEWYGVTTDSAGRVVELDLEQNNLRGVIPPEIRDLSHLKRLILWNNALEGHIPTEIGALHELTYLDLDENGLRGRIPPSIGNLINLDSLFLRDNALSGPIPPTIGNLTNLRLIWLHRNRLQGVIPPSIGNLKLLTVLSLYDNDISGSIPTDIGRLTNLTELKLSFNRLIGQIPSQLGNLSHLKQLWLGHNRLSASIPRSIGNLKQLTVLDFRNNQLEGPIPEELGDLESLIWISLARNNLSGQIPATLSNAKELRSIWLWSNSLSGSIPETFGDLPHLTALGLSDNELSGTIPGALFSALRLPPMSETTEIDVKRTSRKFDGNEDGTPPWPGGAPGKDARTEATPTRLGHLDLRWNRLVGELPPEIGEAQLLKSLWLSGNFLRGVIGKEITTLRRLRSLDLTSTHLCLSTRSEVQHWAAKLAELFEDQGCTIEFAERLALWEFGVAIDAISWASTSSGWYSEAPHAEWDGVTTEGLRVVELDLTKIGTNLPEDRIRGQLYEGVTHLTALRRLILNRGVLSGELTSAFAELKELVTLDLRGHAELTGQIDVSWLQSNVDTLLLSGTNVCKADVIPLTRWAEQMGRAEVMNCEGSGGGRRASDARIVDAKIGQSTLLSLADEDIEIVAGRDAWVGVLIAGEGVLDFLIDVRVMADGEAVWSKEIAPTSFWLTPNPSWTREEDVYGVRVPARFLETGYHIEIQLLDGESLDGLALRRSGRLSVRDVPPASLLVVPVLEAVDPDSSVFAWTDQIYPDAPEIRLLQWAFPVSELDATFRVPFVTNTDVSDEEWRVLRELRLARALEEDDDYRLWYGAALSNRGYVRGLATLSGTVALGKPDGEELAHEVGHLWSLLHAPCGDVTANIDPNFPTQGGVLGSIGVSLFEDGEGRIVPSETADIMGYCYTGGWLSSYHYEKAQTFRDERFGMARSAAETVKRESVVVWGDLSDGEIRLDPPMRVFARPQLPDGDGPYVLEMTWRMETGELRSATYRFKSFKSKYGDEGFLHIIPVPMAARLVDVYVQAPSGDRATVSAENAEGIAILRASADGSIISIVRNAMEAERVRSIWEGHNRLKGQGQLELNDLGAFGRYD